jgi:hypothetical protein
MPSPCGRFVARTRALSVALVLVAAASLLSPLLALADTIVLKNGRRITAIHAVEAGDKVTYQTAAGELSLPRSIVDHIEKGGDSSLPDAPGHAAAKLAISPPAIESNSAIDKGTIRDGAVDRAYLARLDGDAHSGLPWNTWSAPVLWLPIIRTSLRWKGGLSTA